MRPFLALAMLLSSALISNSRALTKPATLSSRGAFCVGMSVFLRLVSGNRGPLLGAGRFLPAAVFDDTIDKGIYAVPEFSNAQESLDNQ